MFNDISDQEIINRLKLGYNEKDYHKQLIGLLELGTFYYKKINKKNIDLKEQDYHHQQYRYATHATALYTYALSIYDRIIKNQIPKDFKISREEIISSVKEVERAYLELIQIDSSKVSEWDLDEAHREFLNNLREETHIKLQQQSTVEKILLTQIDSNVSRVDRFKLIEKSLSEYQLATQHIYRFISKTLRNFIKILIKECEEMLGEKAPCHAVVCFGSLARDEATPYSDLEFGILITEDKSKEYFRKLTRLLHLKVLCLGETTPRMQHIEILDNIGLLNRHSESPVKNGFSFDGQNKDGRKTPLGKKYFEDVSEEEQYELILTPKEMIALCKQENSGKESHLFTTISTASFIEGDENLFNTYQQEISNLSLDFLQEKSQILLPEAIGKFEPKMGIVQKEGHFFDAKYDFYRLINMIVENISLYYGIKKNTFFECINALEKNNIFTEEGASNLKRAASNISNIRLRTYLVNESQNNYIVSIEENNIENINLLSRYFCIDQNDIFEIYYTLIPLHDAAKEFLSEQLVEKKNKILFGCNYYNPNKLVLGRVYLKLNMIQNAKKSFIEYREEQIYNINSLNSKKINLTENDKIKKLDLEIMNICLNLNKTNEFLWPISDIKKYDFDKEHEILDEIITKYAPQTEINSYKMTQNQLRMQRYVLDLMLSGFEKEDILDKGDISNELFCLFENSNILCRKENYEKAIKINKNLEFELEHFSEESDEFLKNKDELFSIYFQKEEYQRAIDIGEEILLMKMKIYGNKNKKTAYTHRLLADSYKLILNYSKAEEHAKIAYDIFSESIATEAKFYALCMQVLLDEIKRKKITEEIHVKERDSLDHRYEDSKLIGNDNQANRHLKLEEYEFAKKIADANLWLKKIKYGEDTIEYAVTLCILAKAHFGLKNYEESILFSKESYAIFRAKNWKNDPDADEKEVKKVLDNSKLQQYLVDKERAMSDCFKKQEKSEFLNKIYLRLKNRKIDFNKIKPIFESSESEPTKLEVAIKLQQLLKYDTQKRLQVGNDYLLKNDLKEARKHYEIIGLDPINLKTHFDLYQIYYAAEWLDESINHLEVIIKIQPKRKILSCNIGCLYHIKALKEHEKGNTKFYEQFLIESKGNYSESIKILKQEKNIFETPFTVPLLTSYGNYLIKNERFKEAISFLNAVVSQKNIKDHEFIYYKSHMIILPQELKYKISNFEELKVSAISLAYYLIITAYQKIHDSKNALFYLEKFKEQLKKHEVNENNFFSYQLLAYAYQELDYNKEESEKILLKTNLYEKDKLSKSISSQFDIVSKKPFETEKNDLIKLSKKKMADKTLSVNGLQRNSIASENNGLLYAISQQISIFLKYNYPEKNDIFLFTFFEFVKSKLGIVNNYIINFDDKIEGTKIASTIDNYLMEKLELDIGLEFSVLEEDEIKGLNFFNISYLKDSFFKKDKENIPIQIIFNGDFYEPLFFSKKTNNYSQMQCEKLSDIQHEKIMKTALNVIKEGYVALKQKEYKLALERYSIAKEIFQKCLGENHDYVFVMQKRMNLCEKYISFRKNAF